MEKNEVLIESGTNLHGVVSELLEEKVFGDLIVSNYGGSIMVRAEGVCSLFDEESDAYEVLQGYFG